MTRGSERTVPVLEEWNREDPYYLLLLKECNDREVRFAHLQGLKLGEAPWAYDDAIKLAHEIDVLKNMRYAYIEHLIRIYHPLYK
jgi:hypothetical protein